VWFTAAQTYTRTHRIFHSELRGGVRRKNSREGGKAMASDGDVELSFHRISDRVSAGDVLNLGVTVTVKNPRLEDAVRDRAQTHVRYAGYGVKHFSSVKEWLKGDSSVTMRFAPYETATVWNLPNILPVELVGPGDRVLCVINVALQMQWFTKSFLKDELQLLRSPTPGKYKNNLLFFGMAGAGKSTLINSVHTMLSDEVHGAIAKSGGGGNHITTTFGAYPGFGTEHGTQLTARFNLFDTWGLEKDENYNAKEFEAMLEGCVKTSTSMDEAYEFSGTFVSPRDAWKIGCVVFCVSYEDVDEQVTDVLRRLQQFVGAATASERNCVVAMTHCDNELSNFPSKEVEELPAEIAEKIGWLSRDLGIPKNRVFPVVSYTQDNHRTKHFGVDRLLYALVEGALRENDAFMRRIEAQQALADDDNGDLLN
jgi:predicted GTPase